LQRMVGQRQGLAGKRLDTVDASHAVDAIDASHASDAVACFPHASAFP